jgi:hypothetical protein
MSCPFPLPADYAATACPAFASLSCRATVTKILGATVVPDGARPTARIDRPTAAPLRAKRSWIGPGGATWSITGVPDTRISANPARKGDLAASRARNVRPRGRLYSARLGVDQEAERSRMELSMPAPGVPDLRKC